MKNFIILIAILVGIVFTSCKKEEVEPRKEWWNATVKYQSNVAKLPVTIEFKCGNVAFTKTFASRPNDATFKWDTAVSLHEFDSITYHMVYAPLTCNQNKPTQMFVMLHGNRTDIIELGYTTQRSYDVILKGRVRCYWSNVNHYPYPADTL